MKDNFAPTETKRMQQLNHTTSSVKGRNVKLKVVDKFCYLGRVLSSSTTVDADISSRLSKASVAFGRLSKHL